MPVSRNSATPVNGWCLVLQLSDIEENGTELQYYSPVFLVMDNPFNYVTNAVCLGFRRSGQTFVQSTTKHEIWYLFYKRFYILMRESVQFIYSFTNVLNYIGYRWVTLSPPPLWYFCIFLYIMNPRRIKFVNQMCP